MGPILAAAIQMSSTPDKSENLAQARELLDQALRRGCRFVAFPENFGLMAEDSRQIAREAETLKEGLIVESLQEWAAEHDLWILAGSVPLRAPRAPGKITNTSLLVDPDGGIVARYDKIHLFDAEVAGERPYQESKRVKPGDKTVTHEVPFGVLGLSICYDLRFPELYRKLVDQRATALAIPSAFTAVTGRAHWDPLTRARAIENQCYVIAPAQTGTHDGGRQTHGHTRIIDPWGRIIAERPAGIGAVIAEIRPSEIERIRGQLPCLVHRQL